MPMRAASVGWRKRFPADQPGGAVLLLQHKRPDPVAVLRTPGNHVPWFNTLESHTACAKVKHVANLWVLELWQDAVNAVHVEAEQFLDPVVGVGATARRRAHLRKPWPDRRGWRIDCDRASRDSVGDLE